MGPRYPRVDWGAARRHATPLLAGISLARVVAAVPVMVLIYLGAYVAAAALFTAAAATDFLDGYLARRWHSSTALGVFLDTTADKLLVAGVLIALVVAGRAWGWAAALIIGREIAVLGLKAAAASDGTVVYPSIWGKIKFVVQFAAIFLAILRYDQRVGNMFLDEWAMTAAVIVTVLSAWSYLKYLPSAFRNAVP